MGEKEGTKPREPEVEGLDAGEHSNSGNPKKARMAAAQRAREKSTDSSHERGRVLATEPGRKLTYRRLQQEDEKGGVSPVLGEAWSVLYPPHYHGNSSQPARWRRGYYPVLGLAPAVALREAPANVLVELREG